MKKLIAILAICMVAIPMMAVNATAPEVTRPYEWVEYSEYSLSGKDTAILILKTIYQDISLDYKGWFPQFDEEWQRDTILTEISTAITSIDNIPEVEPQEPTLIIVNIQDLIEQWVLNNGEGKDYNSWLSYAIIFLENPDDTVNSTIGVYSGCCAFSGWNNCYEWLQ
jgi:hypothetical protein